MINENFMLTEEQVKKYLKRIKMSYPLEATLENLHKLQLNPGIHNNVQVWWLYMGWIPR